MNYLQLVTKLRTECGASGTSTTVVNATGEWARLCGWIADAWLEIQEKREDWEWMRADATFNTTANVNTYTPAAAGVTSFASWRINSFRAYLQAAGVNNEQILGYRDYRTFRDYYLLSSRKSIAARPTEITVAPNKSLILGLIPNDIYVVSGEYYSLPITLATDADIPAMPPRFHLLPVYRAMMSYGAFESASEVYDRGEAQYKAMMHSLEVDQLPRITR